MRNQNLAESEDREIDKAKADIVFKYYEDQWTHVRHHETQRSSLTLQLLVLTAALGATFLQTQALLFRMALAVLMILLGILGFLIVIRTEKAVQQHMKRARAARKSLEFLEKFLTNASDFPRLHFYYASFYVVMSLIGVAFLLFSLK